MHAGRFIVKITVPKSPEINGPIFDGSGNPEAWARFGPSTRRMSWDLIEKRMGEANVQRRVLGMWCVHV